MNAMTYGTIAMILLIILVFISSNYDVIKNKWKQIFVGLEAGKINVTPYIEKYTNGNASFRVKKFFLFARKARRSLLNTFWNKKTAIKIPRGNM